ncbi:MAG: acyltransferase family protein [Ilumatobacteraceae bacterium]
MITTRPAPSSSATANPTPATPHFRGDIEGLRAIAVLAVLAYHAKLGPFHGGYVGVDVFFVISGFLITSLLLRDLLLLGPKALPGFWARRARRLLPGSFVVLVATLVVGRLVLDPLAQRDLMRDGLAATTFTVNIVFAHRQNDYLASQLAPSPLLHFWSLALEEQFYLGWPLLLLAATSFRRRARWLSGATIGVLLVGSLILCIRMTPQHQPAAFFLLPTRAWELLAGAALAVAGSVPNRIPGALRAAGAWMGLAVVVAVTMWFSDLTRFPGAAAILPVSATVLVLAAGTDGYRYGPTMLLNRRPLTWIGARSYSIYLWHWPVLVLAAAKFGPLQPVARLAALLVAVVLAALSYRFIENPARRSTWLGARARRSFAVGATLGLTTAMLATALLLLAPSLTGGRAAASPTPVSPAPSTTIAQLTSPLPPTPAEPSTASTASTSPRPASTTTAPPDTTPDSTPDSTVVSTAQPASDAVIAAMIAANAATLQQGVTTEVVPSNLLPSLVKARADKPQIYADGCILSNGQVSDKACFYGDTTSSTTIALFGDSHAAQWFPALQEMALQNHWRLDVRTKKGCPTADIPIADPARGPECGPWRKMVMAHLAAEHPDLIIMSAYRYTTTRNAIGATPDDVWRNGLQTTLDTMRPLAKNVLVLGDTPTPLTDVPGCVSSHLRNVSACMNPRSEAIKPGRLSAELEVAVAHHAAFVPTGDWLCTSSDCPVVIGNLLVYRDNSHMTTATSLWLEPYLQAVVAPLLAG